MNHYSTSLRPWVLASSLIFGFGLAGCDTVGPMTEPPPCPAPTAGALQGTNLEVVSFRLTDGYLPALSSNGSERVVIPARDSSTRALAARLWTGAEWQTWELGGSDGGTFRTVEMGGRIEALARTEVDGTDGFYVYRENAAHTGFEAPLLVGGFNRISIYDVGELPSAGLAAAVGQGTSPAGTTNMLILERARSGVWTASAVLPGGMSGFVTAQAVGYHTDGHPWVAYFEVIGGRTFLKLTRRAGTEWTPGETIAAQDLWDESGSVDAVVVEPTAGAWAVLYWNSNISGTNLFNTVRYNLNDSSLGSVQATASTTCPSCRGGTLSYEADGVHGIYASRDADGAQWYATVDQEVFSPLVEIGATGAQARGTVRAYHQACGTYLLFRGFELGGGSRRDDFFAVPLPAGISEDRGI